MINWQKLTDYVMGHDVTKQQVVGLTLQQAANFLESTPDEVKRSIEQIKAVIRDTIDEKERQAKFENTKAYILAQKPNAVVQRDDMSIVIKDYLL